MSKMTKGQFSITNCKIKKNYWLELKYEKKDFYYDVCTILIGLNLQYEPYTHFGYWSLVSDP